MIEQDGKIVKPRVIGAIPSPVAAAPAGEQQEGIAALVKILDDIDSRLIAQESQTVPLLKKIEKNTRVLLQSERKARKGTDTDGTALARTPGVKRAGEKPPRREEKADIAIATSPSVIGQTGRKVPLEKQTVVPGRKVVAPVSSGEHLSDPAAWEKKDRVGRERKKQGIAAEDTQLRPQRVRRVRSVAGEADTGIESTGEQVAKTRDDKGKFVSSNAGPDLRFQQIQDAKVQQEGQRGIVGAIKRGLSAVTDQAKGDSGKEVIGRAMGGALYDAYSEIKTFTGSLKEDAQDEDTLLGKGAKALRTGVQKVRDRYAAPPEPLASVKEAETGKSTTAPVTAPEPTKKNLQADQVTAALPVAAPGKEAATATPLGKRKGGAEKEVVKTLKAGDKKDAKRHAELIKAVTGRARRPATKAESLAEIRAARKSGPGSSRRERTAKPQGVTPPLRAPVAQTAAAPGGGGPGIVEMVAAGGGGALLAKGAAVKAAVVKAALVTAKVVGGAVVAKAVVATIATTAVGYGIGSLINAGLNKVGGAITGDKGWTPGGAIYDAKEWVLGRGPKKIEPQKLGAVSEQYESGGRGAGTVSTGKGDKGGVSYGKYQLATNTGTAQDFISKSEKYKERFAGLTPGTQAFTQRWQQTARTDQSFGQAQHDYIKKTHYEPTVEKAGKGGFNVKDRGVQEALWSQGVQHGQTGNQEIIDQASKSLGARFGGMENAPAAEQIKALYGARTAYASKHASPAATVKRYSDEMFQALEVSRATKGTTDTAIAKTEARPLQQPQRLAAQSQADRFADATGGRAVAPDSSARMTLPGMDQMVALMTQLVSQQQKDKKQTKYEQIIQTEFSDTMLTLMAYDRV